MLRGLIRKEQMARRLNSLLEQMGKLLLNLMDMEQVIIIRQPHRHS